MTFGVERLGRILEERKFTVERTGWRLRELPVLLYGCTATTSNGTLIVNSSEKDRVSRNLRYRRGPTWLMRLDRSTSRKAIHRRESPDSVWIFPVPQGVFDQRILAPTKSKRLAQGRPIPLAELSLETVRLIIESDESGVDAQLRRQTAESTLVPDLAALFSSETTSETLVAARVGQGRFRTEVLRLWANRCCVTGIETTEAIRASHIKPWRDSTDDERLDPANGLPLSGTLDGLFDAGLITFGADGRLVASVRLSSAERERLGIAEARLSRVPEGRTAQYLAHHREEIFLERSSES